MPPKLAISAGSIQAEVDLEDRGSAVDNSGGPNPSFQLPLHPPHLNAAEGGLEELSGNPTQSFSTWLKATPLTPCGTSAFCYLTGRSSATFTVRIRVFGKCQSFHFESRTIFTIVNAEVAMRSCAKWMTALLTTGREGGAALPLFPEITLPFISTATSLTDCHGTGSGRTEVSRGVSAAYSRTTCAETVGHTRPHFCLWGDTTGINRTTAMKCAANSP